MFFWDPTFILIIPALALAIYAQVRVKNTYSKYSQIHNNRHMTGHQAAIELLHMNGISDVEVEETTGTLSDHYDPRVKKVRLSHANYQGTSLSALAVAAHEVGHVVQHAKNYFPLHVRHMFLPITNFGSWIAFPLFIIGFFFNTPFLMDLGILLYGAVVVFEDRIVGQAHDTAITERDPSLHAEIIHKKEVVPHPDIVKQNQDRLQMARATS